MGLLSDKARESTEIIIPNDLNNRHKGVRGEKRIVQFGFFTEFLTKD